MSDLITDFPALLNYWDFDKNIKIDVEKITITSKKHINWKCPTCSYEWKASTSKSYKNIQIIQKSVLYVSLEKCS